MAQCNVNRSIYDCNYCNKQKEMNLPQMIIPVFRSALQSGTADQPVMLHLEVNQSYVHVDFACKKTSFGNFLAMFLK